MNINHAFANDASDEDVLYALYRARRDARAVQGRLDSQDHAKQYEAYSYAIDALSRAIDALKPYGTVE